ESLRCGTTLLGEIASSDWPPAPADLPAIDMVVFRELICLRPSQLAQIEEDVQRHLQTAGTCSWQAGLSPHAPFTCHGKAVQLAVETSRRYRLPLAMHLAESPEEREWLQTGQGPLADLLADRQADTYPGPLSVDEIVRQLAGAHRALIVHGNYLSDAEIKSVAAARDRLSVVYCPRTHAYFQHAPYPLQKYLAAGVTVALGTDGRGSNPDLSLLAELRHVAAGYPHLPRDQILNMGTLAGATALGQADRCGSLTPGKEANFAVVPLPDADPADPHELLLHSQHEVQATIFRGAEWSR
ncbi:MAG: amidohydrolase family protein, partial [Planctomycetales bacterium]|nr:amidohydrolase family protein [Planctomycetales bacterium]NIM09165.1 amidohydrolase family protein [Planctomycetales bacterium]NIN08632.1 amidohydrolase family protein [Planctomycetales bacterium]NIN77758.1 amidohydrolase family protein [Planctomycetales bacterium]NIO34934.1 amidohydrolase family protein [Planctomycetales bacterium]